MVRLPGQERPRLARVPAAVEVAVEPALRLPARRLVQKPGPAPAEHDPADKRAGDDAADRPCCDVPSDDPTLPCGTAKANVRDTAGALLAIRISPLAPPRRFVYIAPHDPETVAGAVVAQW